jgi:hypothetical protein
VAVVLEVRQREQSQKGELPAALPVPNEYQAKINKLKSLKALLLEKALVALPINDQ